jgi:two-component system response regulator AtoC
VIAATNRDLEACVARKEFRADLYYRLNVFRLRLPPLRERVSDIRLLARHFLDGLSEPGERKMLSAGALRKLESHSWPGNVRELGNVIRQAAAFAGGSQITEEDILLPWTAEQAGDGAATFRDGKARMVAAFERSFIEELLRKNGGNVTHAAREANKDRRTLGRLIKKYNINSTRG